jgi:hypothetical protein
VSPADRNGLSFKSIASCKSERGLHARESRAEHILWNLRSSPRRRRCPPPWTLPQLVREAGLTTYADVSGLNAAYPSRTHSAASR